MKTVAFKNPTTGKIVETTDKAEIKRMTACCWQKVKQTKQVYAKGLENGNAFLK